MSLTSPVHTYISCNTKYLFVLSISWVVYLRVCFGAQFICILSYYVLDLCTSWDSLSHSVPVYVSVNNKYPLILIMSLDGSFKSPFWSPCHIYSLILSLYEYVFLPLSLQKSLVCNPARTITDNILNKYLFLVLVLPYQYF